MSYTKLKLILICSIPPQLFSCTFKVYWYIHKVYKLMVKCHNLPMMHIRPVQYGESSNKSSVLTIKDARFIFQSIKVKINILAYVSFLEFVLALWRVSSVCAPMSPCPSDSRFVWEFKHAKVWFIEGTVEHIKLFDINNYNTFLPTASKEQPIVDIFILKQLKQISIWPNVCIICCTRIFCHSIKKFIFELQITTILFTFLTNK